MTATIPKKTRKRNAKKTRERNRRILRERQQRILDRIANRPGPERDQPMMTATNIHYELADRVQGLAAGGIGAMLLLAQQDRPDPRHRPQSPSPQAASPLSRIRPRPEHRLQHPRRRQADRTPRTATQRRGLPRCPGRRAHPRPHHRGRLLPPLRRARRRDPDGRHQSDATAGLGPAARRVLRRGDPRRRRHPRRHRRRVQARHRHRLQRHLGLSPPADLAGQHRRAALPGQSQRQPALARGGRTSTSTR